MRHIGLPVLLMALVALAATPRQAHAAQSDLPAPVSPSFDCGHASGKVEQAICSHPDLAALDVRAAAAFRAVQNKYGAADRKLLLANQRVWLSHRGDPCSDWPTPSLEKCISYAYEGRIDQFNTLGKATALGPALSSLLWTTGAVCDGDEALIRFDDVYHLDDSVQPPPDIGGGLARAPATANQCRLRNGRIVRFKTLPDNRSGSGPCGAEGAEMYSVWIGDKKVVSRETRFYRCSPDVVRAIYFDGRHLIRCGGDMPSGAVPKPGQPPFCTDISHRLSRPIRDPRPLNSFVLTKSAPGREAFCKSLVRRVRPEILPEGWPNMTAYPLNAVNSAQADESFDLNNSGRPQRVIVVQSAAPGSDDPTIYWVIPPAGMSLVEAHRQVNGLNDTDDSESIARKRGFLVFSINQTPLKNLISTYGVAFRRAGSTYIFYGFTVIDPNLPSEIITRPQPDGTQKLLCQYKAEPDL